MQTPPSKRALDFGSPSQSPSPSQSSSSSKKVLVVGYVLDVTAIMKGYYFYIQLQDDADNAALIPVYNSKIHPTFTQFEASGDPIKVEVFKQDDGKMKVGSYGHAYPAAPTEVCFPLNSSLKKTIQLERMSRRITIKDLKMINARVNKEKFTVKGRVNLGPEDPCLIQTAYGEKYIKKDIEIEDASGKIEFHIFSNRLEEFQHCGCYELTNLQLSDYQGIHLGLTRDSIITLIEELKGLPPPLLKPSSKKTYRIVGFDSYTNERIFYYCKKCRKEIPITDDQNIPLWLLCPAYKCNTRNRTTNMTLQGACDVNIFVGKNEDIWVSVLPKIMEQICRDEIKNVGQVISAIESVGECRLTVEKGKVEEIKFGKEDEKKDEAVAVEQSEINPSGTGAEDNPMEALEFGEEDGEKSDKDSEGNPTKSHVGKSKNSEGDPTKSHVGKSKDSEGDPTKSHVGKRNGEEFGASGKKNVDKTTTK